ncbi:hypothetical protein VTK26DRAFT_7732 [Humicola hyalothermophila]
MSADLELALQLHREDLEGLKARQKGKGREGQMDDLELAIQLYEAELESFARVASDQALSRSIARAIRQDADLIGALVQEEEQAYSDRQLAVGLENTGNNPPTIMPSRRASAASVTFPDNQLLARLEALYVSPEEPEEHQAESSTWAARRLGQGRSGPTMVECASCGDKCPRFDVFRCPCSHDYCRECLESLFRLSMSDESLFPPRCCSKAIPFDSCRAWLSSDLAREFPAKKVEMETPNRTYCHRPACSAFIPPQHIAGEVATCTRCGETTCAVCKCASHAGDCPHDPAAQALLRMAEENGWQRCYSCRRLVELNHGCYHMTCRCGAQFCYSCGEPWKTCPCAQWDEARLIARANVIVDRDADAQRLDNAGRAHRVAAEVLNLEENHECLHARWRTRGGVYRCDECNDVLPQYIYECLQCRIMACRRCRYNRL